MKIKNITKEEQRVLPNEGPSFTCAPGAEVDVAEACAVDLVASFPSIWESAGVKPKSKKKES